MENINKILEANTYSYPNLNSRQSKYLYREFSLYYSSYGYIKINNSELNKKDNLYKFIQYRQIPFKPEDCLRGTIYKNNLRKEIKIQIKTFFDDRLIYTLEKIDIYSPLNIAVQKLFDQIKKENMIEHITSQSQYRIFSCRKKIHQLNPPTILKRLLEL